MGKRRTAAEDVEARQAPDINLEADTLWYVCADCHRAFALHSRLRTHHWTVHKYKGMANVLIMSQWTDLAPVVKIRRCSSSSRGTEGNVDQRQDPDHVDSRKHQCVQCSRKFDRPSRLKKHVLLVHSKPVDSTNGTKKLKSEPPDVPETESTEYPVNSEEEATNFHWSCAEGAPEEVGVEVQEFVDVKPRLRLRPRPSQSQLPLPPAPTSEADSDDDNDREFEPDQQDEDENEGIEAQEHEGSEGSDWEAEGSSDTKSRPRRVGPRSVSQICNKTFCDNSKLKRHMDQVQSDDTGAAQSTQQKKEEQLKCDICGKPNLSSSKLNSHKRNHNARSIQCPKCGKLFKSNHDLRTHLRQTHAPVRNFKCGECGKCFKVNKELLRHQVVHIVERTVACSECSLKFKATSDLNMHRRSVHQRVACRVCGVEIHGAFRRHRHEVNEHDFQGVAGAPVLKCMFEGCGRKFLQKSLYKKHQQEKHGDLAFTCETCGAGFTTERYLQLHRMTHLPREELPHACGAPLCGKRFRPLEHAKIHRQRVHEGKKKARSRPVPCRVCGREYRTKMGAMNHELRVHDFQRSAGRAEECSTCGQKFPTKFMLQTHELSHGEARAIVCETCGKGFKTKANLEQHQMTHVPYEELPHVCDVCGKRFGWPKSVREHKLKYHGVETLGVKKRVTAAKRALEREEYRPEITN